VSFQPTPKEALVLWNLLTNDEEPAVSKVKPKFTLAECQPLKEAGLIELEQRGRATHLVLTDKAWKNALDYLIVEGAKSHAVTVPKPFLERVKEYFRSHEISLVEFLRPQSKIITDSANITIAPEDLEEKIREAYLEVSGGSYNVRVRLSELRQHLEDIPRADIDRMLGEMELAGRLVLMPINDPQDISSEDEKAAIDVGGHKRHVIYMKG
jgi:hypothetical protein